MKDTHYMDTKQLKSRKNCINQLRSSQHSLKMDRIEPNQQFQNKLNEKTATRIGTTMNRKPGKHCITGDVIQELYTVTVETKKK